MRLALATPTPEITAQLPVALLSGSFPERLAKARRLGYTGVELMVCRPHALSGPEIRRQVEEAGLQVAAISSAPVASLDGLTLLAPQAAARRGALERLHGLACLADETGCRLVTLGSFRGRLGSLPPEEAKAVLEEAAQVATGEGSRLALEPLNRYENDFIHTAAEGLALCQPERAGLGLLLDTFHMNIEEASPAGALRQVLAAGRLLHVHLGDSNRRPAGGGHIDFRLLLAELQAGGYTGWLSAEHLPLPDPDQAAAFTAQVINPLLVELAGFADWR